MQSSSLSKQDYLDIIQKAQDCLGDVYSDYPDTNDLDDMDTPLSHILNALGEIQQAVNLISDEIESESYELQWQIDNTEIYCWFGTIIGWTITMNNALKWSATIITLIGAVLTAKNLFPYNVYAFNIGCILWIIWGYRIKENCIILVNGVLLTIYLVV